MLSLLSLLCLNRKKNEAHEQKKKKKKTVETGLECTLGKRSDMCLALQKPSPHGAWMHAGTMHGIHAKKKEQEGRDSISWAGENEH